MDQSETRDSVPGLREGRGCFQTPVSSGIPLDASHRQNRAGCHLSMGQVPQRLPPPCHPSEPGQIQGSCSASGWFSWDTDRGACVCYKGRGVAGSGDICYKTFHHRQRGLTSQSVLPVQGPFPARDATERLEARPPGVNTAVPSQLCERGQLSLSVPALLGGMINHLGGSWRGLANTHKALQQQWPQPSAF